MQHRLLEKLVASAFRSSAAASSAAAAVSSPPTPASAACRRLRSLLPQVLLRQQRREHSILFGLVLIPALTQVVFHVATRFAPRSIQLLGLDPTDLNKAAAEELIDAHPYEFTHSPNPCPVRSAMFDTILFLLGLSLVMLKGAFQAIAVAYPSYKTFKALESRSLRAAQSMLLYWTITSFVNATKEFADQLLGSYASFFVWKFLILALKAAPLLVGPERMYNYLVKPFYEKHEEKIDTVVEEAHKIKSIAQDAAPAVKGGDVDSAKSAAGEILHVVKEDTTDLVHSIQKQALELTDQLQAKSAELGVAWDRKGVVGLMERGVAQFESGRDALLGFTSTHWETHGPFIKQQTATLTSKASEYAPIAKTKALNLYTANIQPRVQPILNTAQTKYTETIKPFVLAQRDRIIHLWVSSGAERQFSTRVAPFLRGTVEPFITQQLIPFLVDSFLPAVYETLIAMKDQISDLAASPSDEVKTVRVHQKRTRAEARKERRQDRVGKAIEAKDEAERQPGQIYKRQKAAASTSPEAEKPTQTATLSNRKQKTNVDSSIDAPKKIETSIDAETPLKKESPIAVKESTTEVTSKDADIARERMISPNDVDSSILRKHGDSDSLKGEAWGTEPRTSERAIAAE